MYSQATCSRAQFHWLAMDTYIPIYRFRQGAPFQGFGSIFPSKPSSNLDLQRCDKLIANLSGLNHISRQIRIWLQPQKDDALKPVKCREKEQGGSKSRIAPVFPFTPAVSLCLRQAHQGIFCKRKFDHAVFRLSLQEFRLRPAIQSPCLRSVSCSPSTPKPWTR
jgi:hypothetical protein